MATYNGESEHLTNITGWVCVKCRRYWGNKDISEKLSKRCCSPHSVCEDCGGECNKDWNKCPGCRHLAQIKKWESFEIIEWDGETPLFHYTGDLYFWTEDDYRSDYPDEGLHLVVCYPNKGRRFELDEYLCDQLGEDQSAEDIAPKEVTDAVKLIDDWMSKTTFSWSPSNQRVIVKTDSMR